jgi:hypothetical protein
MPTCVSLWTHLDEPRLLVPMFLMLTSVYLSFHLSRYCSLSTVHLYPLVPYVS